MSEALLAEAPLYRAIADCRLCECGNLESVFDLGVMALTGVFPKPGEAVPEGPLELLRCADCGLVQLAHNYDASMLFGASYGYRSGLNPSMVAHLKDIAAWAEKMVAGLEPDNVVLDIGCNDGTLLAQYSGRPTRIGVDPLCRRCTEHQGEGAFFSEFFSAGLIQSEFPGKKAKIITSIAMFSTWSARSSSPATWQACWRRTACGLLRWLTCRRCCVTTPTTASAMSISNITILPN